MLLKAMLRAAGVFYFAVLFYIFFLARRRPRPSLTRHRFPHNLIPFRQKLQDLSFYHGMSAFERWNFLTDLLGNIALFVPMPFFLAFFLKIKEPWKILFIAACISGGVEITQYFLRIGIADIDDILLNILGAVIGAGILKLFNKHLYRAPLLNMNS
jgi:glycopeptide antibiotics resistance protein